MRPAAVLIAIVCGSAAAISFGLIATAVVFIVLQGEHPELARELRPLLASCAGFVAITGVSGVALYATLTERRWRSVAQLATVLVVLVVTWVYWP